MTESILHAVKSAQAPQERLFQLITGYWTTQAIATAARFGVPDRLAMGPQGADELARTIGADPEMLYRLMRALASVGVLEEGPDHRFALTPLGEYLRSDAPQSLHEFAIMHGAEGQYGAWGDLHASIRTGESGFSRVFGGQDHSEFLRAHPDEGRARHAALQRRCEREARAIAEACDLSEASRVCDVGGGHGQLLRALLDANEHLEGVLFDQPAVVRALRGMHPRMTATGGDFFAAVPEGSDVLFLHHVLHEWSDTHANLILRSCQRALTPGGTLLIAEAIVPPGNTAHPAKLQDLDQLVMTEGGRERTEAHYRFLLEGAGFRFQRTRPVDPLLTLIEAERI